MILKDSDLLLERLKSSGAFLRVEKFNLRHQPVDVLLDELQPLEGKEARFDTFELLHDG